MWLDMDEIDADMNRRIETYIRRAPSLPWRGLVLMDKNLDSSTGASDKD